MKITHDYFLEEYHRFREIMCSTAYTPDQKHDAYGGLLAVYICCDDGTDEDRELRESAIEVLQLEFPMRMGLELSGSLEKSWSIENEYMPGDVILHNGLVWTCSLCHRTNFEKTQVEHREDCPLSDPGATGVKILKLGPWIDYGKKYMFLEADGVELGVYDEVMISDGDVLVVGHINKQGGICDDCSVGHEIVQKYRKVGK